jgi:hypothetical protein
MFTDNQILCDVEATKWQTSLSKGQEKDILRRISGVYMCLIFYGRFHWPYQQKLFTYTSNRKDFRSTIVVCKCYSYCIFSSILCVQTGSGARLASCTMGTGGPFPGCKARQGRDSDHSPPSSAEVVDE